MRVTPCNLYCPCQSVISQNTILLTFHLDLDIRASFDNIGSGLILVLLEVLIEQLAKLGDFFPETVVASGPGISGVQ